MPTSHYEVYQDNMVLRKHGFPQFSADPVGNSSLTAADGEHPKIEIGDLGHFREGRFERIMSLPVQDICGGAMRTFSDTIPMAGPECAGNIMVVDFRSGIKLAPGTFPAVPVGGGPNVTLKCTRGEGAILNIQSGEATFTYCDFTSKMLLRQYMLEHYKQWLAQHRDAQFLSARDLFLVTGTYMTNNWEAATFERSSTSISGEVAVDAVLAEGSISIDWRSWTQVNCGFRLGHRHPDQRLPNHNTVLSFGACCSSCAHPPKNQCIFLRGWQVRPIIDFSKASLVAAVSVEDTKNVEWMRFQSIRKPSSTSSPQLPSSSRESQGTSSSLLEGQVGVTEAEGTPAGSNHNNIYDLVAIAKYQEEPHDVVLVHDDDVIDYLSRRETLEEYEYPEVQDKEAESSRQQPQRMTTVAPSSPTHYFHPPSLKVTPNYHPTPPAYFSGPRGRSMRHFFDQPFPERRTQTRNTPRGDYLPRSPQEERTIKAFPYEPHYPSTEPRRKSDRELDETDSDSDSDRSDRELCVIPPGDTTPPHTQPSNISVPSMSASSNSARPGISPQEPMVKPNRSRGSSSPSEADCPWDQIHPSVEHIYDNLDDYFTRHELDKLLMKTNFAPSPAIPSPPPIHLGGARGAKGWGKGKTIRLEPPIPETSPHTPAFKWMKGRMIGMGAYDEVYLAMNLTTREVIAVKQMHFEFSVSDWGNQYQKAAIDTLVTLTNGYHSNIVQCLGVEQTPGSLSIFMEYVSGRSIGACVREQGKLGVSVVKSFTSQIIDGLEYLHQQNILHRNLKADSILVNPDGKCKISGFGNSKRSSAGKVYDPDESTTAMQGTIYWMVPEVIDSAGGGYSAKVDIWSLGCVWQEMATGERPWKNQDMFYVLNRLGRDKESPPLPDGVILPEDARVFRDACFTFDQKQRPSARDLKSYPYLTLPSDWKFTRLTD